ncbi:MAG: hypothetical protein JNK05_34995 [Myxococcales bacterium]|nr:hypothetical protein [Myxococcales bacterium]
MPESTEGQPSAAPAPSSIPPARDPSPGVRVTQQIREALTDLGGLALAAYLVHRGAITGLHALYFAVVLLLPSPVLLRVAKIIGARSGSAGAGVAVALLSASAAWAHTKVYAVGAAGVLGLAACLGGCSGATPHVQAISPSIVQREGYGTCAETGGKIEVPHAGVVALLTSVCWRPMDAGIVSDAGIPSEPDAAAAVPDAIKPEGVAALVLDGWIRGQCTVPVFAQGAKTLADLDPIRCAVTAPGDRLTVFRRGQRWVTR